MASIYALELNFDFYLSIFGQKCQRSNLSFYLISKFHSFCEADSATGNLNMFAKENSAGKKKTNLKNLKGFSSKPIVSIE